MGTTPSSECTLRQMKELLEQLVGVRSFAVFLASADEKTLLPLLVMGASGIEPVAARADDGGVGEAFATAVPRIEQGDLASGSVDRPVALIPMKVEGKVIGVLAIYAMLAQKSRFMPVDFELFKMFGAHAGGALVCARIFAERGQTLPSFDGLSRREM